MESDDLRVLMAVAITGHRHRAATTSALGPERFDVAAKSLLGAGLLRGGSGEHLALTQAGHARLHDLLARERQALGDEELPSLYRDFLRLNLQVKDTITGWQLARPGPRLRAGDREPEEEVSARLAEVNQQAVALLGRLGVGRPRLLSYAERLEAALARVRAGQAQFVAGAGVDSYHTIWFELHEDLLRTMGRGRSE